MIKQEVYVLSVHIKRLEQLIASRAGGPRPVTVHNIIEATAEFYSLTFDEITDRSNCASRVVPRHVAAYLARELTGSSIAHIARELGRHHTTVMYGLKHIRKRMEEDSHLKRQITEIAERFRQVPQ